MKPLNWILHSILLILLVLLFIPEIGLPLFWTKPRVAVMLDTSPSMNIENKTAQLNTILKDITVLQKQADFDFYPFADSLYPKKETWNTAMGYQGRATDISCIFKEFEHDKYDAILLISDGRHNGPDILQNITSLAPLWSIAVGKGDLPDIGITEACVDDSLNLELRISSHIPTPIASTVKIYAGEKQIAARNISLPTHGLSQFRIPLSGINRSREIKVLLEELENEDFLENNRYSVKISRHGKNPRVLFIGNLLNLETKQILNTLKMIPDITLITYIEVANNRFIKAGNNASADIIVVGPIAKQASPKLLNIINNANGKTPILFLCNGTNLPLEIAKIYPLVPDIMDKNSNSKALLSKSDLGKMLSGNWQPSTIAMDIKSGKGYKTKKKVTALMKTGERVYFAYDRINGNLALQLPQLAKEAKRNEAIFRETITRSIQYLINPHSFPFSILAAKTRGNLLSIQLKSQLSFDSNELEAFLSPDFHKLSIIPTSINTFKLTGNAKPGSYKLHIKWNKRHAVMPQTITIPQQKTEQPSRGSNPKLLTYLADHNHGRIISSKELDSFVNSLPRNKHVKFKPLKTPWLVIIICLILLGEIWYRRQHGLP